MKSFTSNQSGFTLIELLVVISVLAVVLGSISTFFLSSLNMHQADENRMSAQDQALAVMNKLESIAMASKGVTYNALAGTITFTNRDDGSDVFTLTGTHLTFVPSGGTTETLSDSVSTLTLTPIPGTSTLTIADTLNRGVAFQLTVTVGNQSSTMSDEAVFRNKN